MNRGFYASIYCFRNSKFIIKQTGAPGTLVKLCISTFCSVSTSRSCQQFIHGGITESALTFRKTGKIISFSHCGRSLQAQKNNNFLAIIMTYLGASAASALLLGKKVTAYLCFVFISIKDFSCGAQRMLKWPPRLLRQRSPGGRRRR